MLPRSSRAAPGLCVQFRAIPRQVRSSRNWRAAADFVRWSAPDEPHVAQALASMHRRPRVALATYAGAPTLSRDDELLACALATLGIDALPAVWSSDTVRWQEFDAIVIRSCWDYHLQIGLFHAWLAYLDSITVPVWNATDIVRWNSNKRYLLDLAARGIATIPTELVRGATSSGVERIAAVRAWPAFVVKPAVSASGHETHSFHAALSARDRAVIDRVASLGEILVQPFAPEVRRDGEWSLTFVEGVFSHATLKRAAAGEFRVQAEHGGSDGPIVPSDAVVRQAECALLTLPETPLYARVDGILRDGAFLLMELELIEPNLYLENDSRAAVRLAAAIADRLPG